MRTNPKLLIGLLITSAVSRVFGQQENEDIKTETWLHYVHNQNINYKWEWTSDQAFRYSLIDRSWWRVHIRPGINFDLFSHLELVGGIGFFYSQDEFEPDQFEIRPWQGFIYAPSAIGRLYFDFTVRMEERFARNQETKEINERWLVRTRMRLNVPINRSSMSDKTFFINLFTERFWDISNHLDHAFQDRLRASAGPGYRVNSITSWEFNVMYQNYSDNLHDDNVIFRIKLNRNVGF